MPRETCIMCSDKFDFEQVHECVDDFGLYYICIDCANILFDEAIETKETNNAK